MPHGDAVVDRDRVEFSRHTTGFFDLLGDDVADVLEVHVSGYELRIRVGDSDNRLPEITVLHTGRAPQRACAGGVAAGGGRS